MRRRARAGALILLCAAGLAGCGGPDDRGREGGPAEVRPTRPVVPGPVARELPRGPIGARVRRRIALLARPGSGRVLARVGPHTEFGSIRVLAVARRRGRWLGVLAPHLRNGQVGWVHASRVEVVREPWTLEADLSRRLLFVRHHGRLRWRIAVTIGRPGVETPTGRFGVTDRLLTEKGSGYGCCLLALSGHQPHLPQGWGGGDRLAIHGTPNESGISGASSAGCLQARRVDLRRLLRVIPLGATLRIHS